jgi:hypothetical protein
MAPLICWSFSSRRGLAAAGRLCGVHRRGSGQMGPIQAACATAVAASAARCISRSMPGDPPSPAGAMRADQSPAACLRTSFSRGRGGHRQIGAVASFPQLPPPGSREANQTSARIIRTNSHRRLPLQASVSTSPNPIIAGGHTPRHRTFDGDRFRRQR